MPDGSRTTVATRVQTLEDVFAFPDRATAAAFARLNVAACLTATPCRTHAEDLWTSTARVDRDRAAVLCLDCPLLGLCRDYAAAARPAFGVYGGRDWT